MVQHPVLLKESGGSELSSQIFLKPSQLRGLSVVIILYFLHTSTHMPNPPHHHHQTPTLPDPLASPCSALSRPTFTSWAWSSIPPPGMSMLWTAWNAFMFLDCVPLQILVPYTQTFPSSELGCASLLIHCMSAHYWPNSYIIKPYVRVEPYGMH